LCGLARRYCRSIARPDASACVSRCIQRPLITQTAALFAFALLVRCMFAATYMNLSYLILPTPHPLLVVLTIGRAGQITAASLQRKTLVLTSTQDHLCLPALLHAHQYEEHDTRYNQRTANHKSKSKFSVSMCKVTATSIMGKPSVIQTASYFTIPSS